jgi:simple sugar transport system ATP-binding protein
VNPVLELKNITKRFPGVTANDKISFTLKRGEIHSLLGENGAGKTTLMNILYGLLSPDKGEIRVQGGICRMESPKDAIAHGIGMVHQHFKLVPTFTVAENIVLGNEPVKGPFLQRKDAQKEITKLSSDYCLNIHPQMVVSHLSVGEQQRVEILRALYRGAEILILDEPTASLTPNECVTFFEILKTMIEDGKSVIFISHKLDEVMEISDRITVLRKGKVVGTVDRDATDSKELAGLMVGRDVVLRVVGEHKRHRDTAPEASLKGIWVEGEQVKPLLKDIDMDVYPGEILGIAGVDGNGQTELAEVFAGLRNPDRGIIRIGDKEPSAPSPAERIRKGIYYIPAERKMRGSALALPLSMNFILKNHGTPPFSKRGILNYGSIRKFAREQIEEYDIRCPSSEIPAGNLSGGNLQKLILSREISGKPKLLIAEQPTRGLDVGAIEYIHTLLLKERDRGGSVVLISADLDEILALSDRVAVMYEGEIVYTSDDPESAREEIGLAMGGAYCTE